MNSRNMPSRNTDTKTQWANVNTSALTRRRCRNSAKSVGGRMIKSKRNRSSLVPPCARLASWLPTKNPPLINYPVHPRHLRKHMPRVDDCCTGGILSGAWCIVFCCYLYSFVVVVVIRFFYSIFHFLRRSSHPRVLASQLSMPPLELMPLLTPSMMGGSVPLYATRRV